MLLRILPDNDSPTTGPAGKAPEQPGKGGRAGWVVNPREVVWCMVDGTGVALHQNGGRGLGLRQFITMTRCSTSLKF
jgi:hypothetical protein